MSAVRVIGVGSPFGADRIGWDVVAELSRWDELPAGMILSCCARPDRELIESLAEPGLLILIDAMHSGRSSGTVCCFTAAEVISGEDLISTHSFGIKSALRLAEALGSLKAEVWICGIEIVLETAWRGGDHYTAPVPRDSLNCLGIIKEIKKILMDFMREHGYPEGPGLVSSQ
ncbi:MAG: hydrogenase maturation protease [Gammaproteobacteria bacterium]|nr:hydrogenase maturation protease [Gammaproteobacteria bacterium]